MTIAYRMFLAMVAIVLLTAVCVGVLAFVQIRATILPAQNALLEQETRRLAEYLSFRIDAAATDVAILEGTPPIQGIYRAEAAGGVDPYDGTRLDEWKRRLQTIFSTAVSADAAYNQVRLIDAGADGMEVVRVDQLGKNQSLRVVEGDDLQAKGSRTYFQDGIKCPRGAIYTSHIELNEEHGTISLPYMPVLRVCKPAYAESGALLGLVVINVDLRAVFDRLLANARPQSRVYIVESNGDFVMHPNETHIFANRLGTNHTLSNEFPQLAGLMAEGAGKQTHELSIDNQSYAASAIPLVLNSGPRLLIVQAVPTALLLAPAETLTKSVVLGAGAAIAISVGVAFVVARSLSRPIVGITKDVRAFQKGEIPTNTRRTNDELGRLSQAIQEMAIEVRDKNSALEKEVAAHKQTELERERYAERDRLYSAAVQSTHDAIITYDLQGVITSWNPAAERLLGYLAEEVIGQNVSLFIPNDLVNERFELADRVIRGEFIENFETRRVSKQGKTLDVALTLSPISDDTGRIVGVSDIKRDISERKAMARELQRHLRDLERSNEELSQFAYIASHDLQEPLRMVSSYCQLLTDRYKGQLDGKAQKYFDYVTEGAARMRTLINALLTYSRIDRPGNPMRPVDLNAALGEVLRDLHIRIKETGAHIEANLLPTVSGDEVQLRQLMQNLLSNAIKFHGPVPPQVVIDSRSGPNGFPVISVRDNGIGMDPDRSERIFQMFQRLHPRGEYEGTGIGLAVAKKIVERHGGRIWVETAPNAGSTFFFTLPLAQSEEH